MELPRNWRDAFIMAPQKKRHSILYEWLSPWATKVMGPFFAEELRKEVEHKRRLFAALGMS